MRTTSAAPRTCIAASRSSARSSRRRSTPRRASPRRSAIRPSRHARSTRCSSSRAPIQSRPRNRSTRCTGCRRSSSAAIPGASRASSCSSARSPPSRGGRKRVARNGGDQELLLDFLERRAGLAGATPQQIREAVDLAVELDHEERAEALLVRAVAAARETVDGLGSAPWAVLALAARRLAANDLAEARGLTYEIAPLVTDEESVALIDGH